MGQHQTRAWSEAASPGSWDTDGGEHYSDSKRVRKGKLLGKEGGKKERMNNEGKGEGVKEEEKRGHKKDEEVTTGQSFREDGNKRKSG